MTSEALDQLSVVAKLIAETLRPDYSKLIKEISEHEFMWTKPNPTSQWLPVEHRVMFTTEDTCVVQECQLSLGHTRFIVFGIHLSEWETYFMGWVDDNDGWLGSTIESWDEGMRFYGADV